MGPELENLSIALFYGIFFVSIAAALIKGSEPEKAGALILLAMFAIQAVLYVSVPPRFINVDLVSFGIDLACLIGFGWLAVHAKRVWPIWAASFQLLSVAVHFARYIQVEIEPIVYSIMKSSPTGVAASLILIGTICHRNRMAKFGFDQPWTDWAHLRGEQSQASMLGRYPS